LSKKNKFRLQTVLDYKERLEVNAQVALAEIERESQLEQEKLNALTEQWNEEMLGLAGLQQLGTLDVVRIGQVMSFIRRLDQKISEQQQLLLALQVEVDQRRAELGEAVMEKRRLEKLKEANDTRLKLETKLAEDRASDDMTMIQFNHKRQPAGQTGS
jgi:flagellar protein FliJ